MKTLTGKTIGMEFDLETATLAEFKDVLEDKEGIPPSSQRLIFAGHQLDDDKKKLKEYGELADPVVIPAISVTAVCTFQVGATVKPLSAPMLLELWEGTTCGRRCKTAGVMISSKGFFRVMGLLGQYPVVELTLRTV